MQVPPYTIRRAALGEIVALRHRELRPGRPPHTARFPGDDEADTLHVGAFLVSGGEAVGCASFVRRPLQEESGWQLRGMATRTDLHGRGIGRAVLRFAEDVLRGGDIRLLWCNARVGAVGFYETMGWTVASEVFDVPTVGPHRVMRRVLT